jgi:hypothetical protein
MRAITNRTFVAQNAAIAPSACAMLPKDNAASLEWGAELNDMKEAGFAKNAGQRDRSAAWHFMTPA